MRFLLVLAAVAAVVPVIAQAQTVQMVNVTRPDSKDFQIGDRFEIVITGAVDQPVSLRTTRQGRTDWGPVVGRTDLSGRWSTSGQFEKADFGDWREVWTIGGKRAGLPVHFSVGAPCLKDGQNLTQVSGLNVRLDCETANGRQAFATPSDNDPFRTADGRVVSGRSDLTREQYQMEIVEHLMTNPGPGQRSGLWGDEAAALILKMIGPNALGEDEIRNVLSLVRAAFEKPDRIPLEAKTPSSTALLLRTLADSTDQGSLAREIDETLADVQSR